ncbi:MAG: hypothetical protein LBF78_01255 [Treponema sp.]|nr:hypothetical protein [Treponema sp.]
MKNPGVNSGVWTPASNLVRHTIPLVSAAVVVALINATTTGKAMSMWERIRAV